MYKNKKSNSINVLPLTAEFNFLNIDKTKDTMRARGGL